MSTCTALTSHSTNDINEYSSSSSLPFRTRFHNRISVVASTDSPSCTDPKFTSDCDINLIVWKHLNGIQEIPSIDKALYGIDGTAPSFESFADKLNSAKKNFMSLPGVLRAYFKNDVSEFARFLNDSKNDQAELDRLFVKLGLKKDYIVPQTSDSNLPANSINKTPVIIKKGLTSTTVDNTPVSAE